VTRQARHAGAARTTRTKAPDRVTPPAGRRRRGIAVMRLDGPKAAHGRPTEAPAGGPLAPQAGPDA